MFTNLIELANYEHESHSNESDKYSEKFDHFNIDEVNSNHDHDFANPCNHKGENQNINPTDLEDIKHFCLHFQVPEKERTGTSKWFIKKLALSPFGLWMMKNSI